MEEGGGPPIFQVLQALEVIDNVRKISNTVWVNKYQCQRIAERFTLIAEGLKVMGPDKNFPGGETLDGGGSSKDYPGFDELLTVLRKGEALVSSYGKYSVWEIITSAVSRTDNREAFLEIHEELDTLNSQFHFEGLNGEYEELASRGVKRSELLTEDAEKDKKELPKNVEILTCISEEQASRRVSNLDLEKLQQVVTEKINTVGEDELSIHFNYIRSQQSAVGINESSGHVEQITEVTGSHVGLLGQVQKNATSTSDSPKSSTWDDQREGHDLQQRNLTISCSEHLRIKSSDLKKVRIIGRGASAKVYEAIWLGCKVAVKCFKSQNVDISGLIEELKLLISFRHPYVARLVGLSAGAREHMIVMELMSSNLQGLIQGRQLKWKTRGTTANVQSPFDLHEAVVIISRIALGMVFLHSRGVMHRDLKSPNVLVQEHPGYMDVKIADFGLSRYITKSKTHGGYIGWGTGFWRAPEILPTKTADRSRKPNLMAIDVYAFAMTSYEVVTGRTPCDELGPLAYDLVIGGYRPTLPSDLHPDLKALIEKCWDGEPEQRPTFASICDVLKNIRSKQPAVGTEQIPQLHGPFVGLLGQVRENATPPLPESSTWDDQREGHDLQRSKSTISCAEHLRIKPSDLKEPRLIGRGSFAKVYEATWLGCKFAVKRFASQNLDISGLIKELKLLLSLRHPHIVQLVGLSVGDQEYMIVMELMSSNLRELIKDRQRKRKTQNTTSAIVQPFDLHEAVPIIYKIALGMAFLHSRGVMLRDLKSPNVLVREHPGHIDVKLADFGSSGYLSKSETHGGYIGVGTGFWRAPEILPTATADRSLKRNLMAIDVYAFAMISYEVVTGRWPCNEIRPSAYDLVIGGHRSTLPSNLHPDLKALIEQCWRGDPEQRPDFTYICEELRRIQ